MGSGVTIQAPQLDINTVAAGGGSRLFFRAGIFQVGPESAGAHPGPVCYRSHIFFSDLLFSQDFCTVISTKGCRGQS